MSQALKRKLETLKDMAAILSNKVSNVTVPDKKEVWKDRVAIQSDEWNKKRAILMNASIRSLAASHSQCSKCDSRIASFSISCNDCKKHFCHACDHSIHFNSPYHKRTLIFFTTSSLLLPDNFVDEKGVIYQQGKTFANCVLVLNFTYLITLNIL